MTTVPLIKTALPGPRASAVIERDRAVVSPSYTRGYPLVIRSGAGAMVEDVDGNVFLDCSAGIAVTATGHSHPDVVAAIANQAALFVHMSGTDFYYDLQVRLAEELATIVPIQGGVKSFFGNSGTEAIEACIKLARYATGRAGIIAFQGGFHGRTMGALALTASQAVQRRGFGPLMPGVYHAPYPSCYRTPAGLTPEDYVAECLRYIEHELFTQLVAPDEIAAIVIEPIQGTAGNIVPPPGFLYEIGEVAHEYGALFLADEMITGFGRTGKLFGCNHDGVVPDVMTLGKGMASGFPVSALVSTDEIMSAKPFSLPSASSSSYGGNPLAAAAALVTIQTILSDKLIDNSAKVGRLLRDGFEALAKKRRSIANVRGKGLLIGFDLVADQKTKILLAKERCVEFFKGCLERGLIMMSYTPRVRVHPPLILSAEQAHSALAIVDDVLEQLEAE